MISTRLIAFAILWRTPAVLPAQGSGVPLPSRNAALSEEFSELIAIRELRDGRVIVYDRKEARLAVANFARDAVTTIGRTGSGPGEYESIVTVLPIGGDSSLAAQAGRWLLLDGDRVVATLPPDTPAMRAVGLWPTASDQHGQVLSRGFEKWRGVVPDSSFVLLVDRATGRTDTVGRTREAVRRATVSVATGADKQPSSVNVTRQPLDVREVPLLFADGSIAVMRLDPYRVDWRSPDGRWTRGAPLLYREIRMTDAEKNAYIERHPGFRRATSWPEVLPPVDAPTALFATPDGMLVIPRLANSAQPEARYDVVDRTGARHAQLVLRPNEHILGFGARSVYVIETDRDGIQWLRRHPYVASSIRP
jgi:hypothetical protein